MKTIEEIRLENLKTLCSQFKSQRQFALHIGKSPAQVNQWFAIDGQRTMTAASTRALSSPAAREIEEILGKPRGWMDHEHTETQDESGA